VTLRGSLATATLTLTNRGPVSKPCPQEFGTVGTGHYRPEAQVLMLRKF
jgi:hypothetical protein